jgi:hypothetical protein
MSGDYFSEFKLEQGSLDTGSWRITPPDQILNIGWLCAKPFKDYFAAIGDLSL